MRPSTPRRCASRLGDPETASLTFGPRANSTVVQDPERDAASPRLRGGTRAAMAIRLLHRNVPTLESLDVPLVIAELARVRHGIVIFAGPTGSGKSTTLAALVDRINERSARRIVTVEDPVEYRHESRRSLVTQREVGRDTPSFAAALRGVLRADPDVIVVGEMRDAETMPERSRRRKPVTSCSRPLHTGTPPKRSTGSSTLSRAPATTSARSSHERSSRSSVSSCCDGLAGLDGAPLSRSCLRPTQCVISFATRKHTNSKT